MHIIGVTGVSGAGKSTITEMLCNMINAKSINADDVAKNLSKKRRRIL